MSAAAAPDAGHGSLAGRRILVTSGGELGERLAREIRARGGLPALAPLTRVALPEDPTALSAALADWLRGAYDWVLVTSAHGADALAAAVDAAVEAIGTENGDASHPDSGRDSDDPAVAAASSGPTAGTRSVGAVGPATAEALEARGVPVVLIPDQEYSARGLAEAFALREPGPAGGGWAQRILLPLSEIASTELEDALAAAGHDPVRVTAYRTVPTPRDEALERVVAASRDRGAPAGESIGLDAILVASGSGAREVASRFAPLPNGLRVVAIGEPTARVLESHGILPDAVAREHTALGLVSALVAALGSDPGTGPDPEADTGPEASPDPEASPEASPEGSTP